MGRGLLTCVIKFCEAAISRQHVSRLLALTSEGGERRRGAEGGWSRAEKKGLEFHSDSFLIDKNDEKVERERAPHPVPLCSSITHILLTDL